MNAFVVSMLPMALISVGVLAALGIQWEQRQRRKRRGSPLSGDLLRPAGYRVRRELDEVRADRLFDLMMLMFFPITVLSVHLAQSYLGGARESSFRLGATAVLMVGSVVWLARRLYRRQRRIAELTIGAEAEEAVGQELNWLMREGAIVFHDLPADGFNIDHVLVTNGGVFAIETKGRSKPRHLPPDKACAVRYDGKFLRFPDWDEGKAIGQARRQADWLARWLSSAVGADIRVRGVVSLPGWFVTDTTRGSSEVLVVSGKANALRWLLTGDGRHQALSDSLMQRIQHQLDQACRTVKSRYEHTRPADLKD